MDSASAYVTNSPSDTTAVKHLLEVVEQIPSTSSLKLRLIANISDAELETSRTQKTIAKFWEPFRKGKLATDEQYWDYCFRFADSFHEFNKNWIRAHQIYTFILQSERFDLFPPPNQKVVRAIVELAALSRELALSNIGELEDIRVWKQVYEKVAEAPHPYAEATILVMTLENYRREFFSKSENSDAFRSEFLPFAASFHQRFAGCKRERALLYALQFALAADLPAQMQYDIAEAAFALLPASNEKWDFSGPGYEQLMSVLTGARERAKAEKDQSKYEHFKSLRKKLLERTKIRLNSGAPTVTAQNHRMFEWTAALPH